MYKPHNKAVRSMRLSIERIDTSRLILIKSIVAH